MEIRKLQKHGNSLSVNLPPAYHANLGLKSGDYVELALTVDHRIILSKYQPKHIELPQCQIS